MATHSSILAWRIPLDRGTWRAAVHGITKNQTLTEATACMHTETGQIHLCSALVREGWSVLCNK